VVFGDDQLECFDFANFPAFAVYVGDSFIGGMADGDRAYGSGPTGTERVKSTMATVKGHPGMGTAILSGLMERGFDPACSMAVPKPEHGVGHAFLRPAESLGILDRPVVPILVNCYYAPQVRGQRCYQIGKALREVIEAHPSDLKVAVIGSGGLWHTPGMT